MFYCYYIDYKSNHYFSQRGRLAFKIMRNSSIYRIFAHHHLHGILGFVCQFLAIEEVSTQLQETWPECCCDMLKFLLFHLTMFYYNNG